MPELSFKVVSVEAAARAMVPLLQFKLQIKSSDPREAVQGLLLNAQIQLQCPQRAYNSQEKEGLLELFGEPARWGQTLRNRLWSHVNTSIGPFTGETEAVLSVPCSYDLNLAANKYFYALEGGNIPLLFLFSGSIFYTSPEGRLQVERISWERECVFSMRAEVWKELMEHHYPNCQWLSLERDVFDRLYKYKRQQGLASWEQTIASLLERAEMETQAQEVTV